MNEHLVEADAGHKNLALLVYILQGLGLFTGGIAWIIAIVINYIKMDEVRDTWLEGHFRWQMNTFWYGLLWSIIAFLFWLVLMGWLASYIVGIWIVYRIIKGALYLNDNKAIIF
jgi:uncharacterized membrane protein